MIRKIYKEYFGYYLNPVGRTNGFGSELKTVVSGFTFNGLRNSDGTYSTAPAWFTQVNDFPLYDTFWSLTEPSEVGQFDFSWTATNLDGSEVEYIVRVNMLNYSQVDNGRLCSNDVKPLTVLMWLNREGGWSYFAFNGKKTIQVTIPDAEQYSTTDFILRNTDRKGVYDGELLTTGDIGILELDLLQSLKESIQVYLIDGYGTNEQIYKPVILQDGDFTKRKTDEKFWDVSVRLIYAEERQIQTQ